MSIHGLQICANLGLEEVLGSPDPDLVHVDLREGGELTQTRLQLQLTSPRFPEYRQELPAVQKFTTKGIFSPDK